MSDFNRKEFLSKIRRIVVKIGSSILTDSSGNLFEPRFDEIAKQVSDIRSKKVEVIIVSSGAIASGMKKLKIENRPAEIHAKQAIAACGQSSLMWSYEKSFSEYDLYVAQVLLTHDGLADRKRFLNARKTINQLFKMGIIPIVNENDTVAVEEIMFGDNDNLAALVTSLSEADLLILLSDIKGFYDKDPKKHSDARFISHISEVDDEIERISGKTSGKTTVGGMRTKIQAIKKASDFGVPSIIANGANDGVLNKIFEGDEVGTLFLPSKDKLSARKHWIAYNLKSFGEIVVDEGAKKAITSKGKSVLPSGIKDVRGNFGIGDPITCIDEHGSEVAKGITSYSSEEIKKIAGAKTKEVENILGYKYSDEVIHRDDLAVISVDKH